MSAPSLKRAANTLAWWRNACWAFGGQTSVGPTGSRRICRQRTGMALLTKCQLNLISARSGPPNMPTSGRRWVADLRANQTRHWPDRKPIGMPTSSQRRVFNVGPMSGCPPNADQMPTKPYIGPTAGQQHLPIWTLGWCCADIRPMHYVDIQLMLYWIWSMSFQCIADEELTSW